MSTCSTSATSYPSSSEELQASLSNAQPLLKLTPCPKGSTTVYPLVCHSQKFEYVCDHQQTDKSDDFRLMTLSSFVEALVAHKLPLQKYSIGRAKSWRDLWIEVVLGASKLKNCNCPALSWPPTVSPTLYRRVRTVILELSAPVDGSDRFLLLTDHVKEAGVARYGLYAPLEIHLFADEKPSDALARLAVHSLNISEKCLNQHFVIEECTTSKKWQESLSFPGLLTSYKITRYKVTIPDPHHQDLMCLGLPEGSEFKTTTVSSMENMCNSFFAWVHCEEFQKHFLHEQCTSVPMETSFDMDELSDADDLSERSMHENSMCVSVALKRQDSTHQQTEVIEARSPSKARGMHSLCGFFLLHVFLVAMSSPP